MRRVTWIICLLVCICLPGSLSAQTPDANWWESEMLIATGYGAAKDKIGSPTHTRALAKRAAVMDAYRKLAQQARAIHITASETIDSQIKAGNISANKIDAVIKGATVLQEDYDSYGNCTVVMSVPLYGVTDSLATAALKPVAKEDFPPPSKGTVASGNYTGLIIDCGDSDLTPVLTPVIRDADNQTIYSFNNLDYEKVIARGMVGYVTQNNPLFARQVNFFMPLSTANFFMFISAKTNAARAGSNPLIIKAQRMSDGNSCPVISAEDADRILAENNASHFLDNGAVVFTSYRVGGLRA